MTSTVRGVSVAVESTNTQLVSFRTLDAQLLHTLQHLPKQIGETMEQAIRSNLETYAMLRAIHSTVVRSPAYDAADMIMFEDVLGRVRKLPYEYFRHKEVFDAFLRTDFKGMPKEGAVRSKRHVIIVRL